MIFGWTNGTISVLLPLASLFRYTRTSPIIPPVNLPHTFFFTKMDSPVYGSVPATTNHASSHHLSPLAASMLAIGGTIGTGLFFSVASIILFGPFIALVLMFYIAFLVVIILQITAVLAVFLPENGLICKFQFLFLGPLVGLANNLIYWISWCLTYALELSIIVSICRFWNAKWVDNHQTLLILLIWSSLTACNLLPVDAYGKIEFWIALIKVAAIVVWILIVVVSLVADGNVFGVWTNDLPWSFFGAHVSTANYFVNFVSCLILSSFIFQSVESVAITTGDVTQPHETIPKVTRLVFIRIVVFYLAAVLLLTLLVPFDDKNLRDPSSQNLLSSPFLLALLNCGFHNNGLLLLTFNFIILSAIVSAANSNIYFGSRCVEAIAESEAGTSWVRYLAATNADNVPVNAVLVTSAFGLVALLLKFQSISVLFNFLLTCCALAGMLMWCLLCLSYIRFSQALKIQKVDVSRLKYNTSWNLDFWAWFALVNLAVILLCNGLTNYWDFSWLKFLGSYMTPVLFILLWGYFQYTGWGSFVPLDRIELWRGNLKD